MIKRISHSRPVSRRLQRFLQAGALFGVLSGAWACDSDRRDKPAPAAALSVATVIEAKSWSAPVAIDLKEPAAFEQRILDLSDSQVHPRCHEVFEPDGDVIAWPWTVDAGAEAQTLFGCRPEAFEKLGDGRRYVAYGVPSPKHSRGSDLRLVAYNANREVRFHHRLDRSGQALNFDANYRGAFIARPSERLACAGTMWEGGTQLACIDETSGEEAWSGMMPFWSGIEIKGANNSLYGADINGLTRRYPFSGVEMRHRPFEGLGGRGAYYGADSRNIYFAPAIDKPRLSAYDFDQMSLRWRLELPGRPTTSYRFIDEARNLLVLRIETTLYGIDTELATVRWALEVGVDHPPMAAGDEQLYLLLRREDRANLLYGIDPDSGKVNWVAPTPTGTLDLGWQENTLMLRSVRAVRTVRSSPAKAASK
ncbi:MAG: hypothetical protein H0U74_02955 [Bradymonadaceae bacterium]|nr:hypothetical protein [Lujinxingiaceae bacterium]